MKQAVNIEYLNSDLYGCAVIDGRNWHVVGALPGETVVAKIIKKNRNFVLAIAEEVTSASELRIKPKCEHFLTCAGCTMQHVPSVEQLTLKKELLSKALNEIGDSTQIGICEGENWNYRRRARISVKYDRKKEQVAFGFREFNSWFVTKMNNCHVLTNGFVKHMNKIKGCLGKLDIIRQIPQLEISDIDGNCLVAIRHMQEFTAKDLEEINLLAEQTKLMIMLQGNDLELKPIHKLGQYPQKMLSHGLEYHVDLNNFIQINADVNSKMIQYIKEQIGSNNTRIHDFFCGIGNITLALHQQAREVIGYELSELMIQKAKELAKNNTITNCEFISKDLFVPDFSKIDFKLDDIVILDPPRSGAEALSKELSQLKVHQLIYVSCNYQSLIRDLQILKTNYQIKSVTIFDMFSQTKHFETVAVLVPKA